MDIQLKCLAIHRSLYDFQIPKPSNRLIESELAQQGIKETLSVIEHLGYVQIDTISVVERAHHHVLWNRVDHYQKNHLNTLLENKKIFEYWFHAASYIPLRDYRYALRQMNSVKRGETKYFNRGDQFLMKEILARAKAEGEIRSRDFILQNEKSEKSWWKSGVVKNTIEQLYMQGDLMVCNRVGVEKVYALTEDYLSSSIDLTEPSLEEYAYYLYDTVKRSQGVFTWKQLLHLKTGTALKKAMQNIIDEQIDAKIIQQINLASGNSVFVDLDGLNQIITTQKEVKILSPFDNLVIHRDRLASLFNFDYRLECYVKPEKRKYGYFCLPILYGTDIVAKIDCKAHREKGILEIIHFHLQAVIHNKADFIQLMILELERFAEFNHCQLDPHFYHKLKL
ncbi:winged helix-turn-helix domain-containing protein [Acinetobacter shaoyimingii]|uniref:Winged helix-turn-helix domain-containing protein n=1 Tax=Acinetobacter shaoyimingii TaxID=2715164 RepID=A0A6G8RUL4_9GAMM|nr:crosslink repair DNA glycosylase YcaQ family protein [Acinetobacter shaoyimingii]QIO05403.1 winged helix-turn-helix domain-containing protein [Acinetobacter shaoyimingii]